MADRDTQQPREYLQALGYIDATMLAMTSASLSLGAASAWLTGAEYDAEQHADTARADAATALRIDTDAIDAMLHELQKLLRGLHARTMAAR